MELRRLLNVLADGEFHSGEELGALLGVSRTAVWKQLQKVQEITELPLESIKGRGYRIVGGVELLDREQIIGPLAAPARSLLTRLDIFDQLDSTNRLALQKAEENCGRGYTVLAEQQLAGRGRRGRQWVSPFGRNIYCSVVWEFDSGAAALEGLSLAVGVAVAKALHTVGADQIGLKWPNDVVWSRRKLAGILLEMTGDAAGRCQVVIGVGINVVMAGSEAANAIDQPWVDVCTVVGRPVSRNYLASQLMAELLPLLVQFEREGFASVRELWSGFDSTAGQPVAVHLGERVVIGTALGVDDSGALVVETGQGKQIFHGGEVSLRLQP